MSTHTIVMNKKEINSLENKLKKGNVEKRNTPAYALFQYKTSDCTITAYESGKVVFQGNGADFYYNFYSEKNAFETSYPEYGSDEVGTGDYFGPVVVCATQITKQDLTLIKSLKIQDSKQLSDHEIESIAPILMKQLQHSVLIVSNEKYNSVHTTNNMNAIKAKLHNKAFLNLQKKINIPLTNIIVDQFTPEKSYYNYLKDEKEIVRGIHFETKAENKYISVACASIIARYTFVQYFKKMSEIYKFDFPKGAGSSVDQAGLKFVQKYGWNLMPKVCKMHFKNTEKIQKKWR